MAVHNFIAIDLGATSGRVILATTAEGTIQMEEIHRFADPIIQMQGHFYWDFPAIYKSVVEGLAKIAAQGIEIKSIGIDTWGVDVVPIAEDGSILSMPRAYRDPYTLGMPERYFEKIPREKVYQKTGIQIMNFNTLFQIYAGVETDYTPLKQAKELLFMPDALSYMLTGNRICEYTIASTSQMVNPLTGSTYRFATMPSRVP